MTMITPSYLGETIEYSSLHACRSTLEDPTGLPAAVPTTPSIAQGAEQGVNGRGKSGYQGPCPPPGPVHHYHFKLYALDTRLNLTADATAAKVEQAMNGHVLASAELIGTFAR